MQAVVDNAPRPAAARTGWKDRLSGWMQSRFFIPCVIAAFAAIWTLIFNIAYSSAALHMDVMEAWSVGRTFAWGFWKHPPLMGWTANLWSQIFPLTDWSFRLLGMANAALALYAVDLIARRFVGQDKRILILLLLLLTPVYQFHAERFNANTVMLAAWPLATYCFLRSFEERTILWSAATGVLCAVAMLGKYYSIFLLLGFAAAALLHPERRGYLRSFAPWISVLAGTVAMAPHVCWLATSDFHPFHYAVQSHGGQPLAKSAWDALLFVLTNALYLILPALALAYVIPAVAVANMRSRICLDGGLLLLTIIFTVSFVLPIVVVLAMHSDLPTVWHLQGLFPVVIVAVTVAPAINRDRLLNLCAITVALWLVALAIAPLYALYRNHVPLLHGRNFYHQAAARLTQEWHHTYGTPLAFVSGDDGLAFSAVFYSPDHPHDVHPLPYQYRRGGPRRALIRKGWAALCFYDDRVCLAWMSTVAAGAAHAKRVEFEVTSEWLGIKGASAHVVALMIPPAGAPLGSRQPATTAGGVTDLSSHGR